MVAEKRSTKNQLDHKEFDTPRTLIQGTPGCTPDSVPMVFIVLSRDS